MVLLYELQFIGLNLSFLLVDTHLRLRATNALFPFLEIILIFAYMGYAPQVAHCWRVSLWFVCGRERVCVDHFVVWLVGTHVVLSIHSFPQEPMMCISCNYACQVLSTCVIYVAKHWLLLATANRGFVVAISLRSWAACARYYCPALATTTVFAVIGALHAPPVACKLIISFFSEEESWKILLT